MTTPTTDTTETIESRLSRLSLTACSPARLETLAIAHPVADDATMAVLAAAVRVGRKETVILPADRLESKSRGRGWARQGNGAVVVWGERTDGGYRVGPGKWLVGGTDGFQRQETTNWDVKHIQVGGETWTIAD